LVGIWSKTLRVEGKKRAEIVAKTAGKTANGIVGGVEFELR
jgi:hypothetical protein